MALRRARGERRLGRGIATLADLVAARPWRSLGLAALATAALGTAAADLRIDNDLARLLPPDDPVRVAVHHAEAELGPLSTINVVVKGSTAENRRRFADALAADVEGHELLRSVDVRVPLSELDRYALYFLEDDAFEGLAARVRAARDLALCRRQPFLCIDPPDPDAERELRRYVEGLRRARPPFVGPRGHYEREDADALVLFLRPAQSSADLDFSARLSTWITSRIEAVRRDPSSWPNPPVGDLATLDLTVNPVGPHVIKAAEQRILRRDVAKTGGLAFLSIAALLAVLLRSWRAVLLVLVPVAAGVVWTMGATRLLIGQLGVTTSLIAAVILGMGVDAGIHLVNRIAEERLHGDIRAATRRAYEALGAPLSVASATTVGAFGVLILSDVPAYRELGVVAASGVTFCYLAVVLIMPALAPLLDVTPHAASTPPTPAPPEGAPLRSTLRFMSPPRRRWAAAVVGLMAVVILAPRALAMSRRGYERNGRAIQSDSTRARVEQDVALIRRILGRDPHASVALVGDLDAARRAVERGRAMVHQSGAGVLAGVTSITTFLPPSSIDLERRWQSIRALREELPASFLRVGDDDPHDDESELRRLFVRALEAPPPTEDDLPPPLRERFRTTSGQYAVYAHPSYDVADIPTGVRFMRVTDSLLEDDGTPFVGEPSLYARFYALTTNGWPVGFGLAFLVVSIATVVHFRNLRSVLAVLGALAAGFVFLLGAMDLSDTRFTLFNIALLPVILGVGIDHGVYLADACSARASSRDALLRTVLSVAAASTTTAVGFASLLVADSGALRGMGALGALGSLSTALAAVLLVPAFAGRSGRARLDEA